MIGKSNAVLLALLLALPTAFMATAFIAPAVGQPTYSAWLKIVTDSWDGSGPLTPVFPAAPGFPDRYNATNVCVELYKFKNPNRQDPAPLNSWEGPIRAGSPNGTGFIRVSWPTSWENVTIVVKAKSYQGDCIGEGNPFQGIIVYWLTINPTDSFRNKFGITFANSTIGDDGIEVDASTGAYFDWDVDAPFGAGPVDVVAPKNPATWGVDFEKDHNDPRRAWVARAAYIFKLFHEHTWYGTDDVLTYATIFIYDTDHTPANSERSLLQAAITGSDGQSRYTREIYPRAQGLGPNGKFRDNKLVPIPLQTINLNTKEPLSGGIADPEDAAPPGESNIRAPHLNATKRVWWETVLVNQTFYVGREYNGTVGDEFELDPATGKTRPLFGAYPSVQDPSDPLFSPAHTQGGITGIPAGPLSLALNHTVDLSIPGFQVLGLEWDNTLTTVENVANFNNNTVFYARFCVQDADLKIQHPEVGDKLVGAEVTVNLKRTGVVQPYYLSHNILETDASGCTANPHKWPGYRSEFRNFARFPNATNWGLRGSLNVSKFFDPRDDNSPVWRPGGYFERAWGGAWTGPYVNAGRNWSALIPEITYMKTRTLDDDPNYDGFDVQVKWKGGSRNNYGGTAVLVDSIRVPNPYAIALLYDYVNDGLFGGWVFPYTVLANNKLWLQIHEAETVVIDHILGTDTISDPNPTKLEIMGSYNLALSAFDSTTGRFTVTITPFGIVAVNNATDGVGDVDYWLDFGGSIVIENALVSFKKHDVMSMALAFEAGQGQADRGVDGNDDYTTVDFVEVSGGPYELEFWPGPPGTGTVRVLVTGHDLNICILPNNLNTCPNISDFTGAILFKGPPRAISVVSYTNNDPSGSVSGSYTTTSATNPYSFNFNVDFGTPITSGPVNFEIMSIPGDLGVSPFNHPISIAGTDDIDNDGNADDSVTVVGVLNLNFDPTELHYAWRTGVAGAGAFDVVGGAAAVLVDIDSDGTVDATIPCTTFSLGSANVDVYHDPDTGLVTIVSGTITTTCTATGVDVDGDGSNDDAVTITVDIGFSLVYDTGLGGGWPPSTLTFVSGSISSTQSLQIDIDGDGSVDFTFTNNVNVPGPGTISVTSVGLVDRYENTVNTLSCTLTGDIPLSGIGTGTADCTGTVTFEIDIYDDATIDVTVFSAALLSGTAPLTITSFGGIVTITGIVTMTTGSLTGDFDNSGPIPPPGTLDAAQVVKTIDINIVGTLDTSVSPPELDVISGGLMLVPTSADLIDINSDSQFNIIVPEVANVDLTGQSIPLTVNEVVPGIITGGTVTSNSLQFFVAGVEQVFSSGTLTITANTQAGSEPVSTATITVQFQALGSISHDGDNRYEATGTAFVFGTDVSLPGGPSTIFASGTIELHCVNVGEPSITCSATVNFDGFSGSGLPVSGTLVINFFNSFRTFSTTGFFEFTEFESLNAFPLFLRGGVSSVGPIAKAKLEFANFAFDSHLYGIVTLNPMTLTSEGMGIRFYSSDSSFEALDIDTGEMVRFLTSATINIPALQSLTLIDPVTLTPTTYTGPTTVTISAGTTSIIGAISNPSGITFTVPGVLAILNGDASASLPANQLIFVQSFVVPLQDMSNDDRELDDSLFGGYDDFALTGTGMVYITAWVHDIAFKPVDNMGNTLPASNTAVTLIRYNGGPITRGSGSNPDQFQSNLAWSYSQWAGAETGYAIFYQLPGDQAYGVTVTFDNRPVYDEPYEIEKLTETVIKTLVTQVYKLKLVVIDCTGTTVPEAWLKYVEPGGRTVTTRIGPHGDLDFGLIGGGEITVKAIWWKGVWIGFDKATIGSTELPVAADGSVTITIDRNIDSPVVLRAVITDFIFTTWDFNKDNRIPRLNITLTWVGVHPLTNKKIYFLETMDPTGDTNTDPFNTTVVFSQLLKYNITHLFKVEERPGSLKTYEKVEYIFSKMPPTLYNITVTTVPDGDPDKRQTPGSAKWPGRTDAVVDYEIKIDWTSHDKAPTIRKTPAGQVNDRVVLRVYMTWNGQPVTDPDLNPIGNATLYTTCGPVKIDLLTWAHTFWQRIVDGDFDYLREARRIGNATYHIVNDNGQLMEQYVPEERIFTSDITSRWTEDTLLTTWLKAASQPSSIIWWNGTYRKQDLVFLSYVYPLQFTRGEQPWAKFYDKVGLTGTGWNTTVRKEADDPLAYLVDRFFNITAYRVNYTDPAHDIVRMHNQNGTWWSHNFTVVGTEGLWNQQKWRWEYAVSKRLVPEVPYQPYSLVIERPTQELVSVSQKGVLAVPIPVGFITLNLKDEDLARAIPYAVVQLDIYARTGTAEIPPSVVCPPESLIERVAKLSALIIQTVSNWDNGIDQDDRNDPTLQPETITDNERDAIALAIIAYLAPDNVIDEDGDAEQLELLIDEYTSLSHPWGKEDLDDLIMLVKAALADDCVLDESEKNDIIVLIDNEVLPIVGVDNDGDGEDDDVELLEMLAPYQLPPPELVAFVERFAGYKYKTGRDGNLTLLFPTQEAMENYLDAPVKNYTLTVYWYLNSSIVYKDAFNLTKRGYNVEKVAIADVTFVLAISADKDRPVKDLYARIWWFNVTSGATTFPGRITVDHARKTWTYTAVPETRGAAKWTDGKITLPWLPTSERFTKTDYDLVFDTATSRWVYRDVTRSWDIPYPSYANGSRLHGWPYQPEPTGYRRALNFTQNVRIQYRVSVWSDQLPIDPSLPQYGRGAWSAAAPSPATGYNYELVWTRLSTGDTTPPIFRFAWMLFGHPPFDITWYRGPDAAGPFEPIPGYALTRTSTSDPTPGSKTVAIKLNATDIEIPVFWQVGDYELGTYDCGPLVGYKVKGSVIPPKGATFSPITIDRTTAAGTITVGDKTISICLAGKPVGLVSLRSGDTPSTVIWGGSTLRITEVSPPDTIWADSTSPAAGKGTSSDYWKNWVGSATDPVTGKKVSEELVTGTQIAGPDLGIQYMGYGVPYEGAPREHTVIAFSNDPDNRAHRPFIKMFEFQNVSARITDFNGRALPGAFYQLIDSQTGKSAAWSYAGPEGRVVPMPIRKPGGVFIQRVFYLGHGPDGVPTWPVNSFAKWPVAYDSREDETTQETQKPDIPLGFAYTVEAGPWPNGPGWRGEICRQAGDGVYNYVRATLEALASCPPSGWGRSFDVITRIFDLRLRFVYGDAQRPADPYYEFSAPSLALPDQFKITGQGAIFDAKRLARGTYDIVAYWPKEGGAEVGRRTVDISRSNVGTVEGTVVLALRDVSFTVVDRQGRPLSGARVSVSPDLVRTDDVQLRPDQIFTLLRVPDGRTYDFTIEWTSPYGTTARAAVRETPAGLQARGSIVVPVDDISVKVVDFDGRPVAGAAIKFAGQDVGSTDSQGVIIVGQVPLDNDYTISVSKEGTEIGSDRVRFTASRTSATIQAGIYDITVLVKGAAGQPIQGALVELIKGGTTIARAATDASGTAVFAKVVGADYTVRAAYEQFSSTASLAKGTRSAQITLDLYTVLLGVPMTFATFLALIIGLILLVIVVVVIVSEYIRWRGRRLGIYPAAPPKK